MSDLFDIEGNPIVIPGPNKVFDEIKRFIQEELPPQHDYWCDEPKCLGPCNCFRKEWKSNK